MTYHGPCKCDISDKEYINASRRRICSEPGFSTSIYTVMICPKCGKESKTMYWLCIE